MQLVDRFKWSKNGTSRIQPPEKTLVTARAIRKQIGVTRIGDITHLDRLGIPNYSVVLPGTDDYIWVYSGKGFTKTQAQASGLMEAIERYSSLPCNHERSLIRGTLGELSKKHEVLNPEDICEPLTFHYRQDMIMDFVYGFDLISCEEILVPAPLVFLRYTSNGSAVNPFSFSHTNGLASGNVLEEAVCHALCEVVERDAASLAELRSSSIPFHLITILANELRSKGYPVKGLTSDAMVDEPNLFPMVHLEDLSFPPAGNLVYRFNVANISLIVKEITSNIGIPTFNAASAEWLTQDYGYLAEGTGTHPDARVALMRAITEVSQTRAANIQGARDDLRKIKYRGENSEDKRAWQFMDSNRKVAFSDIDSYYNENILDDIKLIIHRLKAVGLKRAIIVDLTLPSIGIPVIRAIVPGLETFKFTKSVIGLRARNYCRI
ncbi:MAG TPA: YcaO-like family protein [Nitrososphaeraceae archaeon]|nr:YcaO-like family protein [Nitrososphaeraceae archaeon]